MIHRFTPISSSWTLTFRATDYCHRWYQSLLGSVPGFFMYQTPMVLKRGSFSTCLHSSCPPIPQIVHIPRHPDFVQRVYTYNSSFQRSNRLTLRWKIISPLEFQNHWFTKHGIFETLYPIIPPCCLNPSFPDVFWTQLWLSTKTGPSAHAE